MKAASFSGLRTGVGLSPSFLLVSELIIGISLFRRHHDAIQSRNDGPCVLSGSSRLELDCFGAERQVVVSENAEASRERQVVAQQWIEASQYPGNVGMFS
jgi:hypothetical protein